MIELKVRKIGNSLGVVLPKEVITHLKTAAGEKLFLTAAPDGGYHLTPYDAAIEEQLRAGQQLMKEYRETFKVLAK